MDCEGELDDSGAIGGEGEEIMGYGEENEEDDDALVMLSGEDQEVGRERVEYGSEDNRNLVNIRTP